MASIREKLSSIGVFCVVAGVVSGVLELLGYELRLFRALGPMSPAAAWAIRTGFVGLGVALLLLRPKSKEESSPAADE